MSNAELVTTTSSRLRRRLRYVDRRSPTVRRIERANASEGSSCRAVRQDKRYDEFRESRQQKTSKGRDRHPHHLHRYRQAAMIDKQVTAEAAHLLRHESGFFGKRKRTVGPQWVIRATRATTRGSSTGVSRTDRTVRESEGWTNRRAPRDCRGRLTAPPPRGRARATVMEQRTYEETAAAMDGSFRR